jgi:hypothetical protein
MSVVDHNGQETVSAAQHNLPLPSESLDKCNRLIEPFVPIHPWETPGTIEDQICGAAGGAR